MPRRTTLPPGQSGLDIGAIQLAGIVVQISSKGSCDGSLEEQLLLRQTAHDRESGQPHEILRQIPLVQGHFLLLVEMFFLFFLIEIKSIESNLIFKTILKQIAQKINPKMIFENRRQILLIYVSIF